MSWLIKKPTVKDVDRMHKYPIYQKGDTIKFYQRYYNTNADRSRGKFTFTYKPITLKVKNVNLHNNTYDLTYLDGQDAGSNSIDLVDQLSERTSSPKNLTKRQQHSKGGKNKKRKTRSKRRF